MNMKMSGSRTWSMTGGLWTCEYNVSVIVYAIDCAVSLATTSLRTPPLLSLGWISNILSGGYHIIRLKDLIGRDQLSYLDPSCRPLFQISGQQKATNLVHTH